MSGAVRESSVYQSSSEGVKKNFSELFVSSQIGALLTYSVKSLMNLTNPLFQVIAIVGSLDTVMGEVDR